MNVASCDPIFVYLCSNRLPESTLTLSEHSLLDKSNIPWWAELDPFLAKRYGTLVSLSEMRKDLPGASQKGSSSDVKCKSSENERYLTLGVHCVQMKLT